MTATIEQIKIDRAEPADAEEIVKVHFAAVHETAASYYPDEIVHNWSPPISRERIQRLRS
jgi:hypothetical protein